MEKEYIYLCDVEYEISKKSERFWTGQSIKDLIVKNKEVFNPRAVILQILKDLEEKHSQYEVSVNKVDIKSIKENK